MKKNFLSQRCAYTPKFAPKVGFSSKFKINFSPRSSHIFAILASIMNFLTPKTTSSNFQASDCFRNGIKTREQNLPLVAKKLNCNNLKTTWDIQQKFFYCLFCVILFKFKNKYPCLVTHGDKPFWIKHGMNHLFLQRLMRILQLTLKVMMRYEQISDE